jgi:CRISPR-associated protein Cmx8
MSPETAGKPDLAKRTRGMIHAYVRVKAEAKSGRQQNYADPEYRDCLLRVCEDVFLRFRASKSQEDFVSYFTATICSVPQYLPEEDYQVVAGALMTEQWVDVKTLAMLALSAESPAPKKYNEKEKEGTP